MSKQRTYSLDKRWLDTTLIAACFVRRERREVEANDLQYLVLAVK